MSVGWPGDMDPMEEETTHMSSTGATTMSDLSEAITTIGLRTNIPSQELDLVLKAARRWDALTSEETIEKGAFALWVEDSKATPENYGLWNHLTEQSRNGYRRESRAVLRAVAGVEE